MKRVACITAVVLVWGLIAGCGKKSESNTTTATNSSAAAATTGQEAADTATGDPRMAVTAFLDALRGGNEKTAESLLTSRAREETARHDMVVQPPGTPNASYRIGRLEYPEDQQGTAYVECIWTEVMEDGSKDEYEVVWVLRKESETWRIGGMATELHDGGPIVFLDFEKPAEMMERLRQSQAGPTENLAGQARPGPAAADDVSPGAATAAGPTGDVVR